MTDFMAVLVFGGALLAAVGIGEGLRVWARWQPESTRRIVHVLTGLLVVVAVPLFAEPTWIYVLALLFIGVNLVAVSRGIFPGMHAIARKSWGTVTFPFALVFALFTCWTLNPDRLYILQISFLVLAISDPLASYVGSRVKRPGEFVLAGHRKSVAGTAAFAFSAAVLVAIGLVVLAPLGFSIKDVLMLAVVVALVAAVAEALGGSGSDNFTIVVAIVVSLIAVSEGRQPAGLLGATLVAGVFAAVSHKAGFLNGSGAMAASLLAFGVFGLGGFPWVLPSFTFFLLSSILSALGKSRKLRSDTFIEKTSRRDSGQVWANGGVGGLLLIAHLIAPHPIIYWGFVGSFAAAAADTWGTEVGTFFRGPTRSIRTFARVEPGESGGISLFGTIGAIAGAAAVLVSTIPFKSLWPADIGALEFAFVVIGGGLGASVVDSMLGATLQASYRDGAGRRTERSEERGRPLPLNAGFRWITNDRVNLACTLTGALIMLGYCASQCAWP